MNHILRVGFAQEEFTVLVLRSSWLTKIRKKHKTEMLLDPMGLFSQAEGYRLLWNIKALYITASSVTSDRFSPRFSKQSERLVTFILHSAGPVSMQSNKLGDASTIHHISQEPRRRLSRRSTLTLHFMCLSMSWTLNSARSPHIIPVCQQFLLSWSKPQVGNAPGAV